jgi:putative transposase
LVVVTKYRRGVLDSAMPSCCEAAMRRAYVDFGAGLREFTGDVGHVRLLVDYPPKVAVSALVNSLKGVPARRLRAEFTGRANRASLRGHF